MLGIAFDSANCLCELPHQESLKKSGPPRMSQAHQSFLSPIVFPSIVFTINTFRAKRFLSTNCFLETNRHFKASGASKPKAVHHQYHRTLETSLFRIAGRASKPKAARSPAGSTHNHRKATPRHLAHCSTRFSTDINLFRYSRCA